MNSDAYQQQQMAAGYNQSNPYESNENHYITNTSAPNDPPPVCNAPPPYNNPPAQNNYPPATNPNPYNNPNSYPRNPHQNINVFQPNPYNRPPPPLPPQSAQPIIILTNNSQRGPPLCPICRQHAGTLAVRKTGTTQWIWCFLLFLCFWPASCIPFCVDSCSDIQYRCPLYKLQRCEIILQSSHVLILQLIVFVYHIKSDRILSTIQIL